MSYYDSRDLDKRKKAHPEEVEMPDRLKKALGIQPEIEQMNRAIKALYSQVPKEVADSVKSIWNAAYNLLAKEISEKDAKIAALENVRNVVNNNLRTEMSLHSDLALEYDKLQKENERLTQALADYHKSQKEDDTLNGLRDSVRMLGDGLISTDKMLKEAKGALQELVDLKNFKDIHGKTTEYLERQPKAWERANKVLIGNSIDKKQKADNQKDQKQ